MLVVAAAAAAVEVNNVNKTRLFFCAYAASKMSILSRFGRCVFCDDGWMDGCVDKGIIRNFLHLFLLTS